MTSPVGLFIRQSLLELNQMDMKALTDFFYKVRNYVSETDGHPCLSTALHDMELFYDNLVSSNGNSKLYQHPKDLFQILRHTDNLWPQDSKHLFVHYSNFLNCNEFEASTEFLQRFFETKSLSEYLNLLQV